MRDRELILTFPFLLPFPSFLLSLPPTRHTQPIRTALLNSLHRTEVPNEVSLVFLAQEVSR